MKLRREAVKPRQAQTDMGLFLVLLLKHARPGIDHAAVVHQSGTFPLVAKKAAGKLQNLLLLKISAYCHYHSVRGIPSFQHPPQLPAANPPKALPRTQNRPAIRGFPPDLGVLVLHHPVLRHILGHTDFFHDDAFFRLDVPGIQLWPGDHAR